MIFGHLYLPNDRDFGSIKKANQRTQHVFVPEDWCNLVENARTKKSFQVVRMTAEDFVSTQNIRCEIMYRKVNTKKEKVERLKIRWLQTKTSHLRSTAITLSKFGRPFRYWESVTQPTV